MARQGPGWDTSPERLTPVLVLVAPLVAACGSSGGSGGGGACGVDAQKQWVLEATRDWWRRAQSWDLAESKRSGAPP